jgi:hypothetical protein
LKAQELRDKLAAVRSFDVLVDSKPVKEVIVDIAKAIVSINTIGTPAIPPKLTEVKK